MPTGSIEVYREMKHMAEEAGKSKGTSKSHSSPNPSSTSSSKKHGDRIALPPSLAADADKLLSLGVLPVQSGSDFTDRPYTKAAATGNSDADDSDDDGTSDGDNEDGDGTS